MTADAWVDLAYSALVAGAIALFLRDYDTEGKLEQRLEDRGVGRSTATRPASKPRDRPPVTSR